MKKLSVLTNRENLRALVARLCALRCVELSEEALGSEADDAGKELVPLCGAFRLPLPAAVAADGGWGQAAGFGQLPARAAQLCNVFVEPIVEHGAFLPSVCCPP